MGAEVIHLLLNHFSLSLVFPTVNLTKTLGGAIRPMPSGESIGPEALPAELLKILLECDGTNGLVVSVT